MNKYLSDSQKHHSGQEEQKLYDHLLDLVETESPENMIDKFRQLFIDGRGYPDREIAATLEKIITGKEVQEEFKFILNRCCHIVINRWQKQSDKQDAIGELIGIFENARPRLLATYSRSRSNSKLLELVDSFVKSDQYLTLKRLVEVIKPSLNKNDQPLDEKPLGILIPRYPYLYQQCLLTESSTYEYRHTIKKLQAAKQRQFEIDLSHYVAHVVRQEQSKKNSPKPPIQLASNLSKTTIQNPTLLSEKQLFSGLRQYLGKIDSNYTQKDLAKNFLSKTKEFKNYRVFKDNLYEYLINPLDSEYGQKQFGDRLYKQLQKTIPHSDNQQFTDFLMMRTCSQILNFLIVDSPQRPQHFVFIDLVSNLGPIKTTSLLLRILLICNNVRPYLEQRLGILFNHYESTPNNNIKWLINILENLNIALTTNFGSVNLFLI